ncbi:MAG: dihydroorotase [Bacteroidetes bacterium]|nr:dihydroorotase [Bacteroidota bacterium]
MSNKLLISGATIINEGQMFEGSILIEGELIKEIFVANSTNEDLENIQDIDILDARGKYLIPGVIDDQVHFRDPGLTYKGDLYTESRAAIAGGVTSFMDMPNTDPKTTTIDLLEKKLEIASGKSLANYSFFLGATNDNFEEIEKADPSIICGLKVFMGASTGNMLVDDPIVLEKIFRHSKLLVAIHSEDEATIRANLKIFTDKYGENIPIEAHPLIRSEEACFKSTEKAVTLAKRNNTRLHVLHLSTAKELMLLDDSKPLNEKRITAEVCVHHLWFDDRDYARLGSRIKWNPAIKTRKDKEGLLAGLLQDRIDIIATDHAPHTLEEKKASYLKCPSGGPLVQHSLVVMMEMARQGKIPVTKVVEKMCHAPSVLYRIRNRGFIRKGWYADLVLLDPDSNWKVDTSNIFYKCGWSPFEGETFSSRVTHTFVNGFPVYEDGIFHEAVKGMKLEFDTRS